MNQIVNQWQQNGNLKTDSKTALLTNLNENSSASIPSEERQTFRISVKLFLFDDSEPNCPSLLSGVDIVLKQLNIKSIDSLIISLPNKDTKLSLDDIKPFWKCAENIVDHGKAVQLGISDLDTTQLQQLYDWAEKTKPTTNQVNLDACCVIPPEMSAFAKQNNIQLLTHNDPKGMFLLILDKPMTLFFSEFLPEERFRQLLSQLVSEPNQWKRGWIARYSIIVVGKGILQTKGFILSANKCSKK